VGLLHSLSLTGLKGIGARSQTSPCIVHGRSIASVLYLSLLMPAVDNGGNLRKCLLAFSTVISRDSTRSYSVLQIDCGLDRHLIDTKMRHLSATTPQNYYQLCLRQRSQQIYGIPVVPTGISMCREPLIPSLSVGCRQPASVRKVSLDLQASWPTPPQVGCLSPPI
jgi:hypothetical protein